MNMDGVLEMGCRYTNSVLMLLLFMFLLPRKDVKHCALTAEVDIAMVSICDYFESFSQICTITTVLDIWWWSILQIGHHRSSDYHCSTSNWVLTFGWGVFGCF